MIDTDSLIKNTKVVQPIQIGEKKNELGMLLNMLEKERKFYGIKMAKLDRIPGQISLLKDILSRLEKPIRERVRFYLYYGGNGAGKSFVGAYLTVTMALGYDAPKYGLPFLGAKKNIWICTKSGSNVKSTIMAYLLGDFSGTRIPPEMIEGTPKLDNGILKSIKLTNGCEIHIKTYDQGQENVQGGNPDWMWLDEEPTNNDVWGELKARTRKIDCEMIVTMTPLNGLTGVHEFFFNSEDEELTNKCKVYHVSSLDNPHTDKTWTLGMTDEERRLRVDGSFENPTGLVYGAFSRSFNVVPHFDPKLLGDNVKFYKAIDFGTSHPTGVVFVAVDDDDNMYVFDEIKVHNTELKEIVRLINKSSVGYEFEYFVRDSAAAREGLEFESQFGIKTIKADKRTKEKGTNISNRRSGILLLNSLFKNGKLMISDRCEGLIHELCTHYYKEGARADGEVNKVDDDLIDALRYLLFVIKKNNKPNESYIQKKLREKQMARDGYSKGTTRYVGR